MKFYFYLIVLTYQKNTGNLGNKYWQKNKCYSLQFYKWLFFHRFWTYEKRSHLSTWHLFVIPDI